MEAEKQVYYFSVQDPNPECLTFGCVATSLDAATLKASIAGFHDVLLLEVRDLRGTELSRVANEEILENPFLGPVWMPVVEELAAAVGDLKPGQFFILNFLARAFSYNQGASPYIQGMQEADGSLHLELGSPQLVASLDERGKQTMEFMGWNEPDRGIPNCFRIFEPGWNIRHVAYVALQTLVVAFGIDVTDIIVPGGHGMSKFGKLGLLDRLDEERGLQNLVGYGLFGLNVLSDTASMPGADRAAVGDDGEAAITGIDDDFEGDFEDDLDEGDEDLNDGDEFYFPTVSRRPGGWMFDDDEPLPGEEPIYYGGASTFRDADVIFERLLGANLVDSRGKPGPSRNPKHSDENGVCLLGQGVKYTQSIYSGDDVDAYYIDVEVWRRDEFDNEYTSMGAVFSKSQLAYEDSVLAVIGGDNWALWIRRGARDAEADFDLADSVIYALGQGVVMWSREMPMPERPNSRFKDLRHLAFTLNERLNNSRDPFGFNGFYPSSSVEEFSQRGVDEFVFEMAKDDELATTMGLVTWRTTGQIASVILDLIVMDYFGDSLIRRLESFVPVNEPHIFISDDGWAIRIARDPRGHEEVTPDQLIAAAAVIRTRIGGVISQVFER